MNRFFIETDRIMRKIFYQIMGLCGVLGVLSACNEDPVYFKLDDQPDEMHIVSSTESLVLNKGTENDNAITFTWDAAHSPLNAEDSVSYSLRLFATANKSDNQTEYYQLGTEREMSFTHDELNTIIGRWVLPGQEVNVTAQVVGTVHNPDKYVKPQTSLVEFTVSGYEKYPTYLYIHMTDSETGTVSTQRLTQRQLGTGLYEGTFDVQPCAYRFTTVADGEYPAYGSAGGEQMVYVTEGNVPEFTNTESGKRTFIVDTNNDYNDCRMIEIVSLPVAETMRICGNGCSIGWDPASSDGLFKIEDFRNPHIYSWTGDFNAGGEVKICCGSGWGDQFFFAPVNGADPLTNHELPMYRYQDDGGDLKWIPTVSGKYKFTLCLDAKNMHTEFVPVN